jgi:hypothetical protein
METITTTSKPTGQPLNECVTAEQINHAMQRALDSLAAVAQSTREFLLHCVVAGELLKKKREEFPPRAGYLEWLAANCPNISQPTAHRLMAISDLYYSSGNNMALPDRLDSVRALYDVLKPPAKDEKKPGGKSDTSAPSRVIAALSRFWLTITRRPPESWDEMERQEFLMDLAAREAIRRKQGWKTIDVETL